MRGGFDTATGAVGQGADQSLGYLDQGLRDALARSGGAGAGFESLAGLGKKYGAGTDLYMDALGINGAEGNTRATSAFQPSMGYNFNLDQGLEAINRRRNAGGMLASGNADRDAQVFGAGLASQEQNNWLNRLQGLVSPELQATQGAAQGNAGLAASDANMIYGAGQGKAQIASSRGSMLADLASRYGQGVAGNEANQGQTLAGLATGRAGQQVGLATNLAPGYTATYGNEAAAQMAGSANMWNFGLNAAKLAMGLPPTPMSTGASAGKGAF